MDVVVLAGAQEEYFGLSGRDQDAMDNALAKLEAVGEALPYPHSSAVASSRLGLRELRPRAGRNGWRALYRRVGDALVVAAIAPEAQKDRRAFDAAVARAEQRLRDLVE